MFTTKIILITTLSLLAIGIVGTGIGLTVFFVEKNNKISEQEIITFWNQNFKNLTINIDPADDEDNKKITKLSFKVTPFCWVNSLPKLSSTYSFFYWKPQDEKQPNGNGWIFLQIYGTGKDPNNEWTHFSFDYNETTKNNVNAISRFTSLDPIFDAKEKNPIDWTKRTNSKFISKTAIFKFLQFTKTKYQKNYTFSFSQ